MYSRCTRSSAAGGDSPSASKAWHWRKRQRSTSSAILSRPQPSLDVKRSEEHTSELQSLRHLVCRLLLEKKKNAMEPLLRQLLNEMLRNRLGAKPNTRPGGELVSEGVMGTILLGVLIRYSYLHVPQAYS